MIRPQSTEKCSSWPSNDSSALFNATLACHPYVYDACRDRCYESYRDFRLESFLPLEFAYPIYAVTFPILLVPMIVSNIFVVLVLSKKHMASATNTVLLYMAVADLFVGLVPFPFTFFYYNLGFYQTPDQLNVWWCYLYQFLVSALPPLCHNVAIWLTVLLAVQRYIYVRYPLAAQNLCNVSNVRKCALFLTLFSILSGCIRFFEFTFIKFDGFYVRFSVDQSPTPDHVTEMTLGRDRLLVHGHEVFCAARHMAIVDWMTVPVFYNVYLWIRVVGFVLAPSIILIVINILLIMEIKEAKKRRERLTRVVAHSSSEKNKREAMKQKETQNTNLMLIIIVTVFLITNLPQGTILAAISVNLSFNLRIEFFDTNYPNLIAMVDNMIILLSYPVNFGIYCSMSSQFRETFTRMFVNVPKNSITGLSLVQNFVASYRRYSTPVTVSRGKKSSRDFLAASNSCCNNHNNNSGRQEEEETKTTVSEMSDKFRGNWSKRWTKEDQIGTKNNAVNIRMEEENCAAKLCPIEQLPELADEEFL